MNIAPCAINGVSNYKRYYPQNLMTSQRVCRACACGLLFLAILFTSMPLMATNNISDEVVHERSNAAAKMVLGIISYSRWPTPLPVTRLCVVAPTHYAEALFNPALMKTAHPIKTQRYSLPDASIATHCDVVYLGIIGDKQRQELAIQLAGHSILTISEDYEQCTLGSAFCLLLEDEQASFKVNMDALARGGVRVHPNVLQLARKKADAL